MDKWFKLLNESRRGKREPTPFKSKAQKAYKKLRRKNDIYSTVAGHKNLKSGAPYNVPVKRAGTDRLRFEEEVEPESFEKQPNLDDKFWKEDDRLDRKIARRLTKIATDFINGLSVPVEVEDIRFTGSLANFNWSKYSDVDLHIVVEQLADDHGCRRADLGEIRAHKPEHGIAIGLIGDVVARTDRVFEACSGIGQRLADGFHAVARLLGHVLGHCHGRVVITGGPGDVDEVTHADGSGIARDSFER